MKPQDMKDLQELIEFLKQHQVAEFDLDRGDIKSRPHLAQEIRPHPLRPLILTLDYTL
jgi:acetyl-CoA carboxylase biotin carboxyl carrier protein